VRVALPLQIREFGTGIWLTPIGRHLYSSKESFQTVLVDFISSHAPESSSIYGGKSYTRKVTKYKKMYVIKTMR